MSVEAVRVEGLVKRFKDVVAVDNISFKVRRGEVYGLLGPNGAGKTTTIHILTTLLRPTSGNAFVAGYDVVKEPDKVRREVGIVFQDPSLDNQLTAYDNMYIHGRLYGLKGSDLKRKIFELLDFVDLREFAYKQVRYFSSGMRRRLEIARSLLHEPDVLFLDEPTLGLDPQTRVKIWEYIMSVRKEKNSTVILTTHYMDEAEELCNRISIIDKGRIIAEGTADELKSLLGSEVVYVRLEDSGSSNSISCLESDFIERCSKVREDLIEVVVKDAASAIPKIFELVAGAGLKIVEITYRRPTLNEVFIHLTGRELRDSLEETPSPHGPRRRWF
ncbi:MAG: ATP-binding cassette domain-containing protein [Zestosphaera sp.]